MPFKRQVEVGRVALGVFGDLEHKLLIVTDIVDSNHVIIEGPTCKVPRQSIETGKVRLTDFVIKIGRNTRTKFLLKAIKEADLIKKWEASNWAKKVVRKEKRVSLNDFDRFKVMVLQKKRSGILKSRVSKLKKAN